jgi:hypothetical protein
MLANMVLVFWNPRGILNKEVEFKRFIDKEDAVYAGISESQTYNCKQDHALSDGRWRWDAGPEGRPVERGGGVARGIGTLIDTLRLKASIVRQGKFTSWHRVELKEGSEPLAVGTGYFPNAQDEEGHTAANLELAADLAYFREEGYQVVFGGDLNAHTGANGDTTAPDAAGNMLLETADMAEMVLVNTMPGKCSGELSRVQPRDDGDQASTIDYVMVSLALAPLVKSLAIVDYKMGSDHKPLVLTIEDLELMAPTPPPSHREAWRIKEIPLPPVPRSGDKGDWSWIKANQTKFTAWLQDIRALIGASEAAGLEAKNVADVLDWSFHLALEEEAAIQIGTKKLRPKATPLLDAATRLAIQHRSLAEDALKMAMANPHLPDEAKREASLHCRAAARKVLSAAASRRHLEELRLFRDVESKQGDSKLFWSKFREVRNSIRTNSSPPPRSCRQHWSYSHPPCGCAQSMARL